MNNLENFYSEYLVETQENPIAHFERLWKYSVAFEIRVFSNHIRLGCIRSFERSKGHGSSALNWLCSLADKHNVEIRGSIQPIGQTRPRLSVNALKQWYRRRGFEIKGKEIKRSPKTA